MLIIKTFLFALRRYAPPDQRRIVAALLHDIGLSRSQARAVAGAIDSGEVRAPAEAEQARRKAARAMRRTPVRKRV